jgi:BON domain
MMKEDEMPEPFFAGQMSGVPTWPGGPLPALNLPQPTSFGNATVGMGAPGMLSSFPASAPYIGLGSPMLTNPFGQMVWVGPLPAWSNPEQSTGLSAPALIGALAMRRGQPMGPATDQDIEAVLYDALEVLSGTDEVEVRCESGRVTLTGSVMAKRVKRDVGETAWAISAVTDVQNNVNVATRRRGRPRDVETQPQSVQSRKQA